MSGRGWALAIVMGLLVALVVWSGATLFWMTERGCADANGPGLCNRWEAPHSVPAPQVTVTVTAAAQGRVR